MSERLTGEDPGGRPREGLADRVSPHEFRGIFIFPCAIYSIHFTSDKPFEFEWR